MCFYVGDNCEVDGFVRRFGVIGLFDYRGYFVCSFNVNVKKMSKLKMKRMLINVI